MRAVSLKAFKQTFYLFPENKLKVNSLISHTVRARLFDLELQDGVEGLENEQIQVLYEKLKEDDETKKIISKYKRNKNGLRFHG